MYNAGDLWGPSEMYIPFEDRWKWALKNELESLTASCYQVRSKSTLDEGPNQNYKKKM